MYVELAIFRKSFESVSVWSCLCGVVCGILAASTSSSVFAYTVILYKRGPHGCRRLPVPMLRIGKYR